MLYETLYYPFFRIEQHDDFDVYTLRYPSGRIEEMVVFDTNSPREELINHLSFLLKEYALEHDDALTPRAMELKKDVRRLFGIE